MGRATEGSAPGMLRFGIKAAATAGATAILCCVAPAALFMLGLVGAVSAISFADAFYEPDGSAGLGAWVLRAIAAVIAVVAIATFHRKQKQCSIDPRRRRKNLILVAMIISSFGLAIFFALDRASASYFDRVIVPAKEREIAKEEAR